MYIKTLNLDDRANAWCNVTKSIINHLSFQTTRQRMADMNALVADAENYLHVGAMDSNGKMRVDPEKFSNFNNGGEMDDSFYQVKYLDN